MFLTGCSNENKPKEIVVGENVNVSIIYETRYSQKEDYDVFTVYFSGENLNFVQNYNYAKGQAETVKVDKLIQCEGYFKVIIEGKELVFSNNYYSYRIL